MWGIVLNVNERKEKMKEELTDRAKQWIDRMERRNKRQLEESHPKEYMGVTRPLIPRTPGSGDGVSSKPASESQLGTPAKDKDGAAAETNGDDKAVLGTSLKSSNSGLKKEKKIKKSKDTAGSNGKTVGSKFADFSKRSRKEKTEESEQEAAERKTKRKSKKEAKKQPSLKKELTNENINLRSSASTDDPNKKFSLRKQSQSAKSVPTSSHLSAKFMQ